MPSLASSSYASPASTSLPPFVPRTLLAPPVSLLSWLLALSSRTPPPPGRPNVTIADPIFDKEQVPAGHSRLHPLAWQALLQDYPDRKVVSQVLGAIRHGVLLGYQGVFELEGRRFRRNLPLSAMGEAHIDREVQDRLQSGRIRRLTADDLPVISPVGTVPKPHSTKLRTIHHLSYPRNGTSVNSGIRQSFVTIRYETLQSLLAFVSDNPGASLWKVDLREAFRSIILARSQSRLLGFHWKNETFGECALSFGGKSSPWLFNIFAEMIHWMLSRLLVSNLGFSAPSHYLDDFFGASACSADAFWPVYAAYSLLAALGIEGSPEKSFWGTQELEVLGIVVNTNQQTASISLTRKQRLVSSCEALLSQKSVSQLAMQKITGHLQFVTQIAPHGKAFLRRLYDMLAPLSRPPFRRRLSRPARLELRWWVDTLQHWDGVTLLSPSPMVACHLWTDASSRGMGAHLGPPHSPSGIWSQPVPRRHRHKDIRFLEGLAVLLSLRHFHAEGLLLGINVLVIHVDNENVQYGLRSGSSRDANLQCILRHIFTFGLTHRLAVHSLRVKGSENTLADLLSRRKFDQVRFNFPKAYSLLFSKEQRERFATKHLRPLQQQSVFPSSPRPSSGMACPKQHEQVDRRSASALRLSFDDSLDNSQLSLPTSDGSFVSFVTAASRLGQPSLTLQNSSPGTTTWVCPPPALDASWNDPFRDTSVTTASMPQLPSSPSPSLSSSPCSKRSQWLTLDPTGQCSSPPSPSPSRVSFDAEKSPTPSLTPSSTSPSLASPSALTTRMPSFASLPAKPTLSARESMLSRRQQVESSAPWPPYVASSWDDLATLPSFNLGECPLSPVQPSSRSCASASSLLASPLAASPVTLSAGEPPLGLPTLVHPTKRSRRWGAGTATATGATLTRPPRKEHPLPRKPSTPPSRAPWCLPARPGATELRSWATSPSAPVSRLAVLPLSGRRSL